MGTRVAAVALLLCCVADGQSCGSVDMSGSSGALTVSPPLSFNGAFTIECWAKLLYTGNNPYLFSLEGSASDFKVLYYFSGFGGFLVDFPGRSGTVATIAPQLNRWYHFAITRTGAGSNVLVFIDGALLTQVSSPSTIGTPSSVFSFGGLNSGDITRRWVGAIADFRIVKGSALYT